MSTDEHSRRLRRPSWRDPRLGVGILLVAASVALGTWAVRDAAGTVAVYAVGETVTPGDELAGAVVVTDVRLGAQESLYVRAEQELPDGGVALRTLGAGELLPAAAVGAAEAIELRPVVVPLDVTVPADLGPGTVVDLWTTPPPPSAARTEEPGEPALVAADLVVAELVEDSSVFAGGTGVSVELLVPRTELPDVLAALSTDGSLVVVPTFGTVAPAEAEAEDEPTADGS